MKKVNIQFSTSLGGTHLVEAVVFDAFFLEGALWLELNEEGTSVKVLPLHLINCVDIANATDNEEVSYDEA